MRVCDGFTIAYRPTFFIDVRQKPLLEKRFNSVYAFEGLVDGVYRIGFTISNHVIRFTVKLKLLAFAASDQIDGVVRQLLD